MVGKITIGPLVIPKLEVFGVQITPEITLLPKITVFDPEWILEILGDSAEWIGSIASGVVDAALPSIIEATFNAAEPYLNGLAEDFYARRGKEKS